MVTDDEVPDPMLAEALRQLHDRPPVTDLWPSIVERLEPRSAGRVMMVRWPTALAAGLVIAVVTSASTALLMQRMGARAASPVSIGSTTSSGGAQAQTVSFAPDDAALARAIDQLQRVVQANLGALDPEARSSVRSSLAALDQAIAQAARRQNAAPDDPRAAQLLTSTLRKKLTLLRTVSALTQQAS